MPDGFDVWVVLASGRVFYDKPLFHNKLPKDAVVYVYKPGDSSCRKGSSSAKPAVAPNAARMSQGDAQSKKEPPKKEGEQKKDGKPKAQGAQTNGPSADKADADELEARRHAQQARVKDDASNDEPFTQEVSGEELARRREQRTTALSTVKRSSGPASMTTSASTSNQEETSEQVVRCRVTPASGSPRSTLWTDPDQSPIRELILGELHALEKAKSDKGRAISHRTLWNLFKMVDASMAQAFEARLLGKIDSLGLTFQRVLKNDPLRDALLGILRRKYAGAASSPASSPCPPAVLSGAPQPSVALQPSAAPVAAAPPPPAALDGITLPVMNPTDEASFTSMHTFVGDWIDTLEASVKGAPITFATSIERAQLLKASLPALRWHLDNAKEATKKAFNETDPTKRAIEIKKAGDQLTAVMYVTKIVELDVNIAVITAWADEQGAAERDLHKAAGVWSKDDVEYSYDHDIQELTHAALHVDLAKITAALPAAALRYQYYTKSLNDFIATAKNGAALSKKVVAIANIVMTAISIYQVARAPAIVGGGSGALPTIMATLPGGVALGGTSGVTSVASAVASIQHLVAIGALDGAIIAGVGSLGGGSGLTVPELQQPTSLSVQQPGQPGGSTPKLTVPSGKPNPAAKPTGPRTRIGTDGNARSYLRENEAADTLAKAGYKVEQNPPGPPGSSRLPDSMIEGEYFDCYAPDKGTSVRNVWSTVEDKVIRKAQAFRIILNLDDWNGDLPALLKQFKDWSIPGLIEVMVVQDGKVMPFFP